MFTKLLLHRLRLLQRHPLRKYSDFSVQGTWFSDRFAGARLSLPAELARFPPTRIIATAKTMTGHGATEEVALVPWTQMEFQLRRLWALGKWTRSMVRLRKRKVRS